MARDRREFPSTLRPPGNLVRFETLATTSAKIGRDAYRLPARRARDMCPPVGLWPSPAALRNQRETPSFVAGSHLDLLDARRPVRNDVDSVPNGLSETGSSNTTAVPSQLLPTSTTRGQGSGRGSDRAEVQRRCPERLCRTLPTAGAAQKRSTANRKSDLVAAKRSVIVSSPASRMERLSRWHDYCGTSVCWPALRCLRRSRSGRRARRRSTRLRGAGVRAPDHRPVLGPTSILLRDRERAILSDGFVTRPSARQTAWRFLARNGRGRWRTR
jgi:hypothetical protein